MQILGHGAYGAVLTDGRFAYKFLHDDPDLLHYTRFFAALSKLSGTWLGEEMRPMLKQRGYHMPLEPCIVMPIYGPTLAAVPLQPSERPGFQAWLLKVVSTFVRAGVCHRDLSLANVCRRPADKQLVLIDMDAAFVTADGPKFKPEFGLYCPFYGYPRDVLPPRHHNNAFLAPVSIFTMWFSAQALYNIAILNDSEKYYTPSARPPRFYGSAAVFQRARRLANNILPHAIIDAAEATFYDRPVENLYGPCPAAWFLG